MRNATRDALSNTQRPSYLSTVNNSMNAKTKMKKQLLIVLAASLTILLLTYLQSYTLSDDVLYHCIWRWTGEEGFVPIRNFGDIIESQVIHYQCLTGRAIVQFVAQTFLGLLSKPVYNVANAVVFGLTVWYAAKYASPRSKVTPLALLMVVFIMMVMIPGFVDDYLWIEGSINYLWVTLAMLCFIFIIERKARLKACAMDYVASPLMLFIGWTHEGIALPIAASLAVLCWHRRREMLHNAALPYIAWFTLGALVCSLSPSTVLRAIGGDNHYTVGIGTKIFLGTYTMTQMRTLWLLAFVMLYAYKKHRRLLTAHLKRYDYLYLAIVFCIAIIYASGVTQPRVCYFPEFLSMLLVVNLLLRLGIARHTRKLMPAMAAILILVLVPGIYYSYKGHCNYRYMKTQIEEGKSDIIRVKPVMGCNYFIRKFTFRQVEFSPNTNYFAPDSTDENVRCAATLLNRTRLVFLPDDMVGNIMDNPDSYWKWGENIAGEMIAIQVPKGTKVNKVTFYLGEDNPPFYKRPFMYKSYIYEAPRWQVIEINGRDFVFFDKPLPKIARRIKDIKVS